jgi:hypothetical protein
MARVRLRAGGDLGDVMRRGLARVRTEHEVPDDFPPDVLAAANEAAAKRPKAGHVDRTDLPFVTLDPAASTDLDQAFCLGGREPTSSCGTRSPTSGTSCRRATPSTVRRGTAA